ncbi:MAG: hypothetical protein J6S07_05425 [Bacteroidaceae bacterium]|nr:hypothetical protein [Bacteroidaceae bacterium]
MATQPVMRNLNATSVGIINWVLAEESGYLAGAPLAKDTIQSIKQVGEFINAYQARQNQFLSALVNRIAMVIVATKAYKNPWSWVKRGTMEAGESIEEIYVNLAKVENFDPGNTTNALLADLFGKRKPDVQAAFHQMNFQKKYPVTVSYEQLATAFTSMNGVANLIEYVVQSLYTAFEYDEFLMCKYLLYRLALDGKIKAVTVADPTASEANAKANVKAIKKLSNEMEFMKTDYNMAKVYSHTQKGEQMVIVPTEIDAVLDVDVLASAFNIDRVKFAGQRVIVDYFDDAAIARLNELLDLDTTQGESCFTDAEITAIRTITMFIIDKDFLMQYDKLVTMREQPVANTLEMQYFLHHWALFSASPFKNAALLTTASNAISSVAVSPSTAEVLAGSDVVLTATVTATGFINTDVVWSIGDDATDTKTKIGADGILHVGADETGDANGEFTVIATSVANSAVYGSATITIGALAE